MLKSSLPYFLVLADVGSEFPQSLHLATMNDLALCPDAGNRHYHSRESLTCRWVSLVCGDCQHKAAGHGRAIVPVPRVQTYNHTMASGDSNCRWWLTPNLRFRRSPFEPRLGPLRQTWTVQQVADIAVDIIIESNKLKFHFIWIVIVLHLPAFKTNGRKVQAYGHWPVRRHDAKTSLELHAT